MEAIYFEKIKIRAGLFFPIPANKYDKMRIADRLTQIVSHIIYKILYFDIIIYKNQLIRTKANR